MADRDFDVVLYGASGFTGRRTVRYFMQHAPPGLRWAVAGRNREKLDALNAGVPVLVAASDDAAAIDGLTARTRVILTTAGPFELYSDRLVEGCVRNRTGYVDITGETVWARSLVDRFHARAAADGTRIIPFCGFDCVPCDLAADWMFRRLGPTTTEIKAGFQVKGGSPNGGTMATALHTWESGATDKMRDPFLLSPSVSRPLHALEQDPRGAHYDADLRAWVAPWVMGVIDTRVVRRSNALLGRDCAYQEYTQFSGRGAAMKATLLSGLSSTAQAAMKLGFVRKMIRDKVPPGVGPSEAAIDGGWMRCEVFGRAEDGRTARAIMKGQGDPANRITVLCVCEAALTLACDADKLPARAGVLTPASGLGEILLARLSRGGLTINEAPFAN